MDCKFDDEEVINELVKEYAAIIRGICRRFYLVGGTSEDLYQEGMIGLLEAVKNFDRDRGKLGDDSFKRYAMTCIKRQIIDAIKHANTKKNQVLNNSVSLTHKNQEDEEFDIEEMGSEKDPEEIYIMREKQEEQIKRLYDLVSPLEKEVLRLYLEGRTASEIAKILNKTPRSVTNTIQRIKLKVK